MSAKKRKHAVSTDEQVRIMLEDILNGSLSDDSQFEDKFQTSEQKDRDKKITSLLDLYVDAYDEKTGTQQSYRGKLFWLSYILVCVFSACMVAGTIVALIVARDIDISGLVALITAFVTLLTSVLGLITIITKFCFPENDEEYITRIVEAIQKNDLEHKKENMRLTAKTVKASEEEKERDEESTEE